MRLVIITAMSFLLSTLLIATHAKNSPNTVTPNNLQYGDYNLVLNGSGIRKKYFIDFYIGSLYLSEKNIDSEAIIESDQPMAIRLFILSSIITTENMKETIINTFKQSGDNLTSIQAHIDTLVVAYEQGVRKGDVYEFINIPGSGVHIVRNKKRLVIIRSNEFKKALFGIWLSKKPIQPSLKRQMLGI